MYVVIPYTPENNPCIFAHIYLYGFSIERQSGYTWLHDTIDKVISMHGLFKKIF